MEFKKLLTVEMGFIFVMMGYALCSSILCDEDFAL